MAQSRIVRPAKSTGLVAQPSESSPWQTPSNIRTFVRCLRLLDLDKFADWPGVTENVFATKSAEQNLQARIKAVEWVLYRLFEIYDPKETQTKLHPFFPPLAPLQSLNLRAAIYRMLTELKKNGVLGRDIVLRKTMLDECKGEKFEKVISTFALVVLRHACKLRYPGLDLEKHDRTPKEQLLPMIIAYRNSLQSNLQQHQICSKRADAYSTELQSAQGDIQRRLLEAQRGFQPVENSILGQMSDDVRRAWVGDERIADILLQGRTLSPTPLPEVPWESSWLEAAGRNLSCNGKEPDLAADLEARVQEQEQRLKRWRTYHASMTNARCAQTQEEKTTRETRDLQSVSLDQHKKLQFDPPQMREVLTGRLQPYHASVLRTLREELEALNALQGARKSITAVYFSDSPAVRHEALAKTPVFVHGTLNMSEQVQAIVSPKGDKSVAKLAMKQDRELEANTSDEYPEYNLKTPACVAAEDSDVSSAVGNSSLTSEEPNIINMANIPSSPPVGNAYVDELSHSPQDEVGTAPNVLYGLKRDSLPTLHERTRASLLPSTPELSFQGIDDDPNNGNNKGDTNQRLPALPEFTASRGTLLERTRQSMSLLPNPPSKSKGPLNSGKQPRFSEIFPVNQFDTPGKPQTQQFGAWSPRSGSSTPRDRLFSEEADYASVFKSRPRIAVSPSLSPERSDLGLESMLTTSGDELELEDNTTISPSRRPIHHE